MAGLGEQPGTEPAVVAGERLERHRRPQAGAAASAALDPVPDREPDRRRAGVPVRERVEGRLFVQRISAVSASSAQSRPRV